MRKIANLSIVSATVRRSLQYRTALAIGLVLIACLLTIIVFVAHVGPNFHWWKHDRVMDVNELPLGHVTLQGVVTYVDEVNQRFWIQDESGAIPIQLSPVKANIKYGQLVRIQARKSHAYDTQLSVPGAALTDYTVRILKASAPLPAPAPATVDNLPEKEKNGIRAQLEGVLRAVSYQGRVTVLYVGNSSREVSVVLPGAQTSFSAWVDATVQVTGVSDISIDAGGTADTAGAHMWVQSANDVKKLQDAPHSTALNSMQDLYRRQRGDNSNRVRLRGHVLQIEQGNFVLVEDRWGVLACQSDSIVNFPPKTPIEISGFPLQNGPRIDLSHCGLQRVADSELRSQPHSSTASLTSVTAVKHLRPQQAAEALPVRLRGVVTYVDINWRQFFFQDSTGGIFVKYAGSARPLVAGERILLTGVTGPGDFAPVIVGAKLAFLGRGQLPKPIQIGARAWSGQLDSQLVEVEGIIHPPAKRQNPQHLNLNLSTSFGPVVLDMSPFGGAAQIEHLVDAKVRIRGVAGEVFNSNRQLIGFLLAVSGPSNVRVLDAPAAKPFAAPAIPINQLLRFSPSSDFSHRVRVTGSVTMVGNGFFYVQDATGGARVEADTDGLSLSDRVDVVGYASPGAYTPALTDAVVHVKEHNVSMTVLDVTPQKAIGGRFDSRLVSIEGTLLSIISSIDSRNLVLRSEGRTFEAVLDLRNSEQNPPPLDEGSVIRLVGICTAKLKGSTAYTLNTKDPIGFNLVIRSPQDIKVLKAASWWNLRHTSLILAWLVALVLAGLGWVAMLRRRVRTQHDALARAKQKQEAIQQLTAAMQEVTSERRFTARVSVQGDDEIAPLSVQFNRMLGELERGEAARLEAESKLRHMALTDELTGLPNRRLFADRLAHFLAAAQRSNGILALLYLDLDGFKLVNDSLGHSVGDKLLGQVSERLQSRIRKSDTLARLGGDEFVVVLTQLNQKEDAELVGNSLLQVLSTPFNIDSHEISISASLGVSVYPENSADADILLQQADSAMYVAKRSGKNRLMYFRPEIGSQVRERMSLENQLRGAISRGEITLHYQPEFDLTSQRLVRFEALARWTHPTLGSIPPVKFIPVAEETGIIIPLGMYILERACADAVAWQEISSDPIQVAVNVSSIQFARNSFVDEVAEVLRQTGLSPKLLQIELTESVMLAGAEPSAAAMRRLGALGVSIAIDDFGTGYSCFSYLPRLPFNTLKIDRSFVRDLESMEMKAMIQSLVTLAHNLNMQVVVEGIETVQQLEMIKHLGGNQVQGYLLGRPTADPVAELRSRKATQGLVPELSENRSAMKASAK